MDGSVVKNSFLLKRSQDPHSLLKPSLRSVLGHQISSELYGHQAHERRNTYMHVENYATHTITIIKMNYYKKNNNDCSNYNSRDYILF